MAWYGAGDKFTLPAHPPGYRVTGAEGLQYLPRPTVAAVRAWQQAARCVDRRCKGKGGTPTAGWFGLRISPTYEMLLSLEPGVPKGGP